MIKGIKYVLFLFIGIGLAYYASKDADFDTIWNAATHLNWGWAFLSMLASYVAMMFRGWRWRILIEPLGYTTRASSPVHAVAFGYLMNDLIPRSGEVARCAVLNKAEEIPMDKLVGTVILERLVDTLNLLMVIALVSWLQADAIAALWDKITAAKAATPGQPQEKSYLIYYILIIGSAAAIFGWRLLKKLKHIAFFGKIHQFALGVFDGLKSILALKQKGWFTIHTIGIWVCWLLMAYFMMKALADTNYMNMADALFFLVAGSFGMVVPTQGGLGAYHLTSKWGFEALGYAGTLGLTFAWISWVGKTVVEIIVGALGFIILDQRAKMKEVLPQLEQWKKDGKKIVFTNGVFDILHVGHVTYLEHAKSLGDILIIGLNDDDSVRKLNKGPERPINDEQSRKKVLEALRAVDGVVIFKEETPLALIQSIQPDVLVKGGDYDPDQTDPAHKQYMVGSKEVRSWGGSVQVIDFVPGFSTTSVVNKLKA